MNKKLTFLLGLCLLFQLGYSQTLVWGGEPGEGQFNGSLDGWTTEANNPEADSTWIWSSNGDLGIGSFFPANVLIASPSASNGCAMFHLDFFTTGGDPANQPTGPPPYPQMTSHLISPPIDISASPSQFMFLRFHQFMAKLNPANFPNPINGVTFSQDGGQTWFPDVPIDCSPDRGVNELFEESRDIPIPGADLDLTKPLQIRFSYDGDFYAWALDDVELWTRVPNETSANPFFSIAANLRTPEGQLRDNVGFLIDVENLGANVARNVRARISISDQSGEIFSDELNYGDLMQDSLAENQPFGSFFPTDLAAGNYTGTYTVIADSTEANPNNNTQTFSFIVTDSTFAKESGANDNAGVLNRALFNGGDWSYGVGNHYHIPNGDGLFARTVTFSLSNTATAGEENNITGEVVFLKLYEWDDSGNYDGVAQPNERVEIANAFHTVEGGDNQNKLITKAWTNNQGQVEAIKLKDNTDYIVAIEYISNDAETSMNIATSTSNDYLARVFQDQIVDSTRVNWTHGVGIIGDDPSMVEYDFTNNFGNDEVPVIRLNVGSEPIFSSTKDLNNLDAKEMVISPIPAKDYLNIELNLTDIASNASLEIYSTNGQLLEVIELGKVQRDNKILDLSNYESGTYFARFIAQDGVLTKSFQVVK